MSAQQRWKKNIDEGRVLTLEDLDGAPPIGKKGLEVYLVAMGVSVTRKEREEGVVTLREKVRSCLSERGVTCWSVNDRRFAKRQKRE